VGTNDVCERIPGLQLTPHTTTTTKKRSRSASFLEKEDLLFSPWLLLFVRGDFFSDFFILLSLFVLT
jgi:hypothetical protein